MTESGPTQTPISPDRQKQQREAAEFRKLPAVDKLLQRPEIAALAEAYGSGPVTAETRAELDGARVAIHNGQTAPNEQQLTDRITENVLAADAPSLRPVTNATGVLIHTNLGRTPLSQEAQDAVIHLSQGYSTLEFDVKPVSVAAVMPILLVSCAS
jgi:L-seryl-tRNA(Ser) seleniumtransferase